MTLKEAFRYQNFLSRLCASASNAMYNDGHRLNVVKIHKMHDANPDAEDKTETVVNPDKLDLNAVVRLMTALAEEREKLACAITQAKASLGFDFDAAIEANKFRQRQAECIKAVLATKPSESVEKGTGYKFNNEGNQSPYVYEIAVTKTESFDRAELTQTMAKALRLSDAASAELDAALVNTSVDYTAPWDVNASFEDVLAGLIQKNKPAGEAGSE